jgi:hypothetical protein
MMIAGIIYFGSFVVAAVAGVVVCLLKQSRDRRRNQEQLSEQVDKALKDIMADGKVTLPKGKIKFKNWARKWMAYSHSLPAPQSGSKHFIQVREMPRLPKDDE